MTKNVFSTFLGFNHCWDSTHYNEHTRHKVFTLSTTNKIHLKCECSNGLFISGIQQPMLYSFVSDKLPRNEIFCELETTHYKKINISALNTITFYLEDDNNEEINFNGEKLTFTLQMIKI